MDTIETLLSDLATQNPHIDWDAAEIERIRRDLHGEPPDSAEAYIRRFWPLINAKGRFYQWVEGFLNKPRLVLDQPINHLPASLGSLTNLAAVVLRSRAIENSANPGLATLPEFIADLILCEWLDASGHPITHLPGSIGRLVNLRYLDVGKTRLTSLPAAIGNLTNLEVLDLKATPLTSLPDTIGGLASLQSLDVGRTRLTSLPAAIGTLTNLQTLYLWNTRLDSLPDEIGKLASLQSLDVGRTRLTSLPAAIGNLINLRHLDLENSPIATLPVEIRNLTNLIELDIRKTHLQIPPEIMAQLHNPQAILEYYFQPSQPLYEAKIVLLGDGAVGKTSLVRRIVDNEFAPGQAQTEGIQIRDWQPHGTPYQFHIWDFGGQELMHSTHQFFLTKRTVYVLVLRSRSADKQPHIEGWLQMIESFASDSPILIVQNYADEFVLPLDERGLRAKYPSIQGFYVTSCKTGAGIDELRGILHHTAQALDHVNDHIPVTWHNVKTFLQAHQRNYTFYERYQEWCEAEQITDSGEQRQLMQLLHDLGIALCFQEDLSLMDTTVLNPQWVTEGIYRIINTESLRLQSGGVLDCRILPAILDSGQYPLNTGLYLVKMMQKFELCFAVSEDRYLYLIPDLLPIEQPDLGDWDDALGFVYEYGVLPRSIMSRFIVRMHEMLDPTLRWRNGAVLHDPETANRALVKADIEDRTITIRVSGPVVSRRQLLAQIRSTFRMIHGTFAALKVEELVPIQGAKPMAYHYLLELEELGEATIIPPGLKQRISLPELLNGIETAAERRLHIHPEYHDLQHRLRAIRQEYWLDSPLGHLEELYETLSGKLHHLELQKARLNPSDVSFNQQRSIDELLPQVHVLKDLIAIKQWLRSA